MWLRDYLPEGINNQARILIYGYQSKLQGADVGKNLISDFGNCFIEGVVRIRDHPLVCILVPRRAVPQSLHC